MNRLLRANLKFHWRRYLATGLAVVIAVIFVVAVFAVRGGLDYSLSRSLTDSYQGASVVVEDTESSTSMDETAASLSSLPGVQAVTPVAQTGAQLGTSSDQFAIFSLLLPEPFFQPPLISGSFPTGGDELALERGAADLLEKTVGDTVQAVGMQGESTTFLISGIYGEDQDALVNISTESALVTAAGLNELGDENVWVQKYLVAGSEDVPPETLVEEISESLGSSWKVSTAREAIDEELDEISLSTAQMSLMLMIFPAIAIVVAIIVVANTFKVLIQQRQKELGLLRCVGATSGQVQRLLLGESAILGIAASAVGVLVGTVLSAWGISALGLVPGFAAGVRALSPLSLALIFVGGVLITVLAGLRPAARIAKAPPLVTFSAADAEPTARTRGWWARTTIGALLTGLGAAGMLFAATLPDASGLGLAILLGPVTLAGLSLFLSATFSTFTGWVGGLWRTNLGRLARGNALRNPGRTAATGVSIVIGVSLIVMMMVGAATVSKTLNAELDSRMGTDLEISSSETPLTESDAGTIQKMEGVSVAAAQRSISEPASLEDSDVHVYDTSALETVVRGEEVLVGNGEALISPVWEIEPGSPLTVCLNDRCMDLTAVENSSWNAKFDSVGLSPTDFEVLAQNEDVQIDRVLAQLESTADFDLVRGELETANSEWTIDGMAPMRAQFDQLINVILTGMIALLAVSVVIALVGVSNTLALSVAERTRELGLLRALGMTSRQTSRLLTIEAVLISITAALLGIVAGVFFGAVGAYSVLGELGDVRLSIPWVQLLAVLLVTLLAAVLASWLPGRRAGRISPVQALAST